MQNKKCWICYGCEPKCIIPADLTGVSGPEECPPSLSHKQFHLNYTPEEKKKTSCQECQTGHKRNFKLEEL